MDSHWKKYSGKNLTDKIYNINVSETFFSQYAHVNSSLHGTGLKFLFDFMPILLLVLSSYEDTASLMGKFQRKPQRTLWQRGQTECKNCRMWRVEGVVKCWPRNMTWLLLT